MRNEDNNDFYEAIKVAAQLTIESGGVPTVDILWNAGNSTRLRDNRGDDDDRIGVSARVFSDYGTEISSLLVTEPDLPLGGVPIPGTEKAFPMVFQEEGAVYELGGELRMVTDNPPPSFP
jgi:hypothetical protein